MAIWQLGARRRSNVDIVLPLTLSALLPSFVSVQCDAFRFRCRWHTHTIVHAYAANSRQRHHVWNDRMHYNAHSNALLSMCLHCSSEAYGRHRECEMERRSERVNAIASVTTARRRARWVKRKERKIPARHTETMERQHFSVQPKRKTIYLRLHRIAFALNSNCNEFRKKIYLILLLPLLIS